MHLDCVKKNKLIDQYTGEYSCKDCGSSNRCKKCLRIFSYPSDIIGTFIKEEGCPFCKEIKHDKDTDAKNYTLELLKLTYIKLEYNEYAI